MRREDIEKLLGGYATDSLTPEERQELFAAALDDQALFDQLASEEALRAALADPAGRADMLSALDGARDPWHKRLAQWFGRPAGLAALAGTAAAVLTLGVFLTYRANRIEPALVTQVRREPARPDVAPPVPSPAPVARPKAPSEEKSRPKPAAEASPPERESRNEAVGVVGGVPGGVAGGAPGGVVGGIIGGIAPRQDKFEAPAAPPPPPPPPPARKAAAPEPEKSQVADSARVNQSVTPAAAVPPAPASSGARALYEGASAPVATGFRAQEQPESKDAAARPMEVGGERRRMSVAKERAAAPAPALASAVAVPHLGIRYAVLRLGSGGSFTEADPATVFATGDRLRLAFEANDAGYLYVLQREAGGGWHTLAAERIGRRVRYVVPRDGALAYDAPGSRQIYVFFSRTPAPALAAPDPRVLDEQVRGSQLVQKGENGATYVVNTAAPPQSQQVGHTIVLNFR